MAASLGKIPTTLVLSAWSRSIGFVECNFWRCSAGEAHVGEDVVLGSSMRTASLGTLGLSWSATWRHWTFALFGVLLGEGGGDEGGDDAPALAAGMGQQVAGEVHAAALP